MTDTKKGAISQAAQPIQPRPNPHKGLWLPLGLFIGLFTIAVLNQTGYITLPHITLPNLGNLNGEEIPTEATIGAHYNYDFSPDLIPLLDPNYLGDRSGYTFYLGSGTGFPPMGLILGPDGILSGTPTGKGGNFEVCVKDVGGRSVCRKYHLNVNPASDGSNTNVPLGTGSPEKWEGTYTSHEVFDNGAWACTTDTTAPIRICMTRQGKNLAGIISFPQGFKETHTKDDPNDICMGSVHCSGGDGQCSELRGHIDSDGNLKLDFLTLDGSSYIYDPNFPNQNVQSSAAMVGDSMTVKFSSVIPGGTSITSTTKGSFTATKDAINKINEQDICRLIHLAYILDGWLQPE
jgi:hypothetical protein